MGRRRAGVLAPIFSLPGSRGIGTFSAAAHEFVDRLAEAGQSIWQILPLGPTGYGDSPYSSFSTHAGNPYFIDLDRFVDLGVLSEAELDELDWGQDPGRVDYGALYRSSDRALRLAHSRMDTWREDERFREFLATRAWLDDYALYMVLKGVNEQRPWTQWPQDLRTRQPEALATARDQYHREVDFEYFKQWVFSVQWDRLHDHAREVGIEIMGDLPIYVQLDSPEVWANTDLFELDAELRPINIAGVPPDGFSATGQLWGNPLYDWEAHRRTGYAWWARRLASQLRRYDILRIDHFRGLQAYWSVPADAPDASGGVWRPGPGMDFFRGVQAHLGEFPVVLEDLGYLTQEVHALREEVGAPGMQLIQFAFDSREPSTQLPHAFRHNGVAYTGTHDNDTIVGWWDALTPADQHRARVYSAGHWTSAEELAWTFITLAMASVADTCVIPLGDYLALGSEGRINTPATSTGNWQWRMTDQPSRELIARIKELTELTERTSQ